MPLGLKVTKIFKKKTIVLPHISQTNRYSNLFHVNRYKLHILTSKNT